MSVLNQNQIENEKYQIALSFAGEQRNYVEEVARHLQSKGVAVFYDGFETTKLWGKSGVEYFHKIFAEQSAYVVMFISKQYVEKEWPIHERKSAFSHMIKEKREFILPVRFDDTLVPGFPEDIIFLKAQELTPVNLAEKIANKLGISNSTIKASQVPPPKMVSLVGEVVFDYSNYNGRYVIGCRELEFETMWTKASNTSIYVYNDPASINGIALAPKCNAICQVANAKSFDYTSRCRTVRLDQIVVIRNIQNFYAAIHILVIKDDTRSDTKDELRFRYAIQSNGSDNFNDFVGI